MTRSISRGFTFIEIFVATAIVAAFLAILFFDHKAPTHHAGGPDYSERILSPEDEVLMMTNDASRGLWLLVRKADGRRAVVRLVPQGSKLPSTSWFIDSTEAAQVEEGP